MAGDDYSKGTKELAGRLASLSYRDMQKFCALVDSHRDGAAGVAALAESLLRAADDVEKNAFLEPPVALKRDARG